jgi:hypothetical protein
MGSRRAVMGSMRAVVGSVRAVVGSMRAEGRGRPRGVCEADRRGLGRRQRPLGTYLWGGEGAVVSTCMLGAAASTRHVPGHRYAAVSRTRRPTARHARAAPRPRRWPRRWRLVQPHAPSVSHQQVRAEAPNGAREGRHEAPVNEAPVNEAPVNDAPALVRRPHATGPHQKRARASRSLAGVGRGWTNLPPHRPPWPLHGTPRSQSLRSQSLRDLGALPSSRGRGGSAGGTATRRPTRRRSGCGRAPCRARIP